jgi:hypothetical protein
MVTKDKLLRDLESIRDMIDWDVSYEAWSLVDWAITQLEDDIDAVMVELEKEHLELVALWRSLGDL